MIQTQLSERNMGFFFENYIPLSTTMKFSFKLKQSRDTIILQTRVPLHSSFSS